MTSDLTNKQKTTSDFTNKQKISIENEVLITIRRAYYVTWI